MKLVGMMSTAVLFLTLGTTVPVYAQQEEHAQQDEKQAQSEKPAQEEKKAQQQEERKPQQEKASQQEERKPQQERASQQEEKKPQQERAAEQHDQQAQRNRGDNHRIPDDRFRANFGHEHVFVINRPIIIEGQPRFQYGGYWFGFNQPWPVGWLYTDNVYVDFVDGGYYLYNPFHPGIRVVVIVI